MDNPAQIQAHSQSGKKYLLLLGASILFLIITIIYFINKKEEVMQTPPIAQPTIIPTAPAGSRVEDQIIIKFKPEVSEATKSQILKKYNATVVKRIDAIQRLVIQVPQGQEDAILNEMKKDNLIEEAEPDYIYKASFVPNDPSLNLQWGIANTGQAIKGRNGTVGADINAQAAWEVARGSGVKIAILDTGINQGHPDLSTKITAKNDFTGSGIEDYKGHGTHTAGIAAASTNNSLGIAGACPDCQLIIGKVLDNSGSGPNSTIAQGIIWAADSGAKVISMSLGGPYNSRSQQDAINYAWNKGAVLVAAAGNGGNTRREYPGANNNIVSVAATNNNDQKASFSTYGTWVDVAAPGETIYSTYPTNSYKNLSGTSMATPMVAGVVGLIWSSSYGTSNTAVVQHLFDTADKISGTGNYWIYGRVNAASAVSGGSSATPVPTRIPTPTRAISLPTSTPVPTRIPTNQPSPTPRYVTPTIYCLGSCTSPTPAKIVTPAPGKRRPPCLFFGDIDGDGFVTQIDLDMASNAWSGKITLNGMQKDRLNVNGDNIQIDTTDILLISDYIAGKITTFPVCSTFAPTFSAASTNTASPDYQQSWLEILLKFIGFK